MFKTIQPIDDPKDLSPIFLEGTNQVITILNQLINVYNTAKTKKLQKQALTSIFLEYKKLERNFSAKQIESCPQFIERIFVELGTQLQIELKANDLQITISPLKSSKASEQLANIIAKMSPTKLSLLQKILMERGDLSTIYRNFDPEYNEYQYFLRSNKITFLGGKNSINYKVIPNNGDPPYVLKLENRFGYPKVIEDDLRKKIALAPEAISRQSIAVDSEGKAYARFINITDFCEQGDLKSYAKSIQKPKKLAVKLYSQMATRLQEITEAGYVFPDMKNSNWLVDKNGNLQIADTKSFLPTKEGSILIPPGFGLAHTKYITPPETSDVIRGFSYSSDKFQAYMLGKNIYGFITQCNEDYLATKKDGKDFDFSRDEFKGPSGEALKELISNLVKEAPEERISIQEALIKLKEIQGKLYLEEHEELLQKLSVYTDENYIEQQKNAISIAQSEEDLSSISEKLTTEIKIFELKAECKQLLSTIMNVKHPNFFDYQTAINKANDLEELQLIKLNLEKTQLKTECSFLFLKYFGSESNMEALQAIEQEENFQALEKTKKELTEKILDLLKAECLEFTDKLAFKDNHLKDEILHCKSISRLTEIKSQIDEALNEIKPCQSILSGLAKGNSDAIKYAEQSQIALENCQSLEDLIRLEKDIMFYDLGYQSLVLVDKIKSSGFGKNDSAMNEFVEFYKDKITNSRTLEETKKLKADLDKIFEQINNPIIHAVQMTIENLRTTNGYGMADKAQRIENAAAKLSIPERIEIMTKDLNTINQELKEVQRQMASHRHFGKRGDIYEKNGEIDETRASSSFIEFKKQLTQIKTNKQDDVENLPPSYKK